MPRMNGNQTYKENTGAAMWYAVRTKYKCEKWVSSQLRSKGIEVYLPLNIRIKRYASKVKRVESPLISCYVFVRIAEKESIRVLQTDYVVGFVKFENRLIPIPSREIQLLKKIVGEYTDVSATDHVFKPGEQVEIIAGNLTGLKGHLVNIKGRKEFVVELESIAHSLLIHVDPSHLRRVRRATCSVS